jgi:nucleotide-binding universal stress UspA family protein
MSYKTILVHVDQSVHALARFHYAAALAHAHGAQLIGAAMFGVSRAVFPRGYDSQPGTLSASYFQPLADHAKRALSKFEAIANKLQVPHQTRFVCDQADDGLARLARFADLIVLSQDDTLESLPDMALHLPEYVILNAARPVLVVPRADPAPYRHTKMLVAWDGSKEASFALSAALPLLRRAAGVTVAALAGKDGSEEDFREQQAAMLDFLGRHHVNPRVMIRAPREDSGHDLLALAAELDCGMMVMGCFGHSRFRELCMGGASRTVLAEASIPVLMAH